MFVRVLCLSIAAALVATAQPAFTNTAPPAVNPPPIAGGFGPVSAPVSTNTPPPVAQDPLAPNPVLYPEANPPANVEPKAEVKKPAPPKLPGVGLRGSVKAVDVKAVTFTVGGKDKEHVVHVSSASRYTRNGKPATISEVTVGDTFSGRIKKNKAGEEVLIYGDFTMKKPAATKAATK